MKLLNYEIVSTAFLEDLEKHNLKNILMANGYKLIAGIQDLHEIPESAAKKDCVYVKSINRVYVCVDGIEWTELYFEDLNFKYIYISYFETILFEVYIDLGRTILKESELCKCLITLDQFSEPDGAIVILNPLIFYKFNTEEITSITMYYGSLLYVLGTYGYSKFKRFSCLNKIQHICKRLGYVSIHKKYHTPSIIKYKQHMSENTKDIKYKLALNIEVLLFRFFNWCH